MLTSAFIPPPSLRLEEGEFCLYCVKCGKIIVMKRLYILSYPELGKGEIVKECFVERGFKILEDVFTENLEESINQYLNSDRSYLFVVPPYYLMDVFFKIKKSDNDEIPFEGILLDAHSKTLIDRYIKSNKDNEFDPSFSNIIHVQKREIRKCQPFSSSFIDTSFISDEYLRQLTFKIIDATEEGKPLIRIESFGLREINPLDLDMTLDARILPNPYWIPALRDKWGVDQEIIDYLSKFEVTYELLEKYISLIDLVVKSGEKLKHGLYTVGICCMGGQHRSVYLAQHIYDALKEKYDLDLLHRELERSKEPK